MDKQEHSFRHILLGLACAAGLLPSIWAVPASALNISGANMVDYTAYPVTTLENVTPMVMLMMSRDHQYFFKAYNDYTDLDGNGTIELTYDNTFEYYGYFDPDKCYDYVETNFTGASNVSHFTPMAFTTDHYCDTVSGDWSGNFLNWASMSRMDIVRKIIYGGKRVVDVDFDSAVAADNGDTVLVRAHLPTDAHSFAKYYNGDDLAKLTPFVPSSGGIKTDNLFGDADGNDDVDEGITICNTTYDDDPDDGGPRVLSTNTPEPPLMRIAQGNFSLWGAGERYQCRFQEDTSMSGSRGKSKNDPSASGLFADSDSPSTSQRLDTGDSGEPDFQVHVRTCVTGLIFNPSTNANNENCRQYDNGNYKPTGLLQEYGEEEQIHFGLFTGTYEKNISGGVLRKNVGDMTDEVDFDDGTFLSPADNISMVNTLDVFKMWGYKYENGVYFGGGTPDNCRFQQASITEGKCASWGNPMSELYAEAVRYFAGLTPTTAFDAPNEDGTDYFPDLAYESSWTDPLDDENWCAGLNIVVINSSLSTYDEDTSHFTDIGAADPKTLTDAVGDAEGVTGSQYLVGRVGATGDEFCTAKTVTGLGDVVGVCPEGPTVDGTYQIAGMAHYAHTEDIRPLLFGDQLITTYAVQLATNVPKISIDADLAADSDVPPDGITDNDSDVTILPAYRLIKNDGGGTLVDFKIIQDSIEIAKADVRLGAAYELGYDDFTGVVKNDGTYSSFGSIVPGTPAESPGSGYFYGKYYVNWEDSEQGGDFDQDMWGIFEYVYDSHTNEISVTTDAIAESTGNGQLFGFIVSGTTQDGFHAFSGIESGAFDDPDPTVIDCNDDPGDGNCDPADGERTYTFTLGTASAELLPDPLFLAAKYGAFDDSNGNKLPDLDDEWDIRDQTGAKVPGGDETPDTYFQVTNPAALEDSLRAVFDQVIERVASGTAAAVVASEQEGTGAVFQALYDPIKSDTLGNDVSWIGTLHALFVDPNGFLREDTDNDDQLDGYNIDKVIEIFYDEALQRARVRRFTVTSVDEFDEAVATTSEDELENLNPIWNSREQLSALTNVLTQRTYSSTAADGRYITTWLDNDHDGVVDSGEQVAFAESTFGTSNFGWLDVWEDDNGNSVLDGTEGPDEADKLVRFIRGNEESGYRNRTVDYDDDGVTEVQRLGDVAHSTPTVMGAPAAAFDITALDESYSDFRVQYRNRRNVVFVGSNDGMIHAFNGGFFNVTTRAFDLKSSTETEHPLGAELWAYVPKNLLGQLQWLKEEDYTHVFYADLKPLVVDAKIFADDATHPGGWGTVLIVGMRLGGGSDATAMLLDTEADGYGDADDVSTKSAYVILDVTDPESPPVLIAEVSPPDLNLTTSFPSVALIGEAEPTAASLPPNKWYLMLGSGPTDIGSVSSSQSARVFAYDLRELVLGNSGVIEDGPFDSDGTPGDGIGYFDTGEAGTFVGEFTIADQDLDMKTEAIYFGTVGDEDSDQGSIYRMSVDEDPDPSNWDDPFILLDADRPFSTRIAITIDEKFQTWLIAGTGRLFTNADKESTTEQSLFGFIDPYTTSSPPLSDGPVSHGSFEDTTSARTFTNGNVSLDGDEEQDTTFEAFGGTVAAAGGWFLDYSADGTEPSERQVASPTLIGGIVLTSAFTPTTQLCGAEGESRLLGRAFDRGLIPASGVFGTAACIDGDANPCSAGETEAIGSLDLGAGLASSPSIHIGSQDVPGKVTVIVQQSTGAISGNTAQTMGGIRNSEISWEEFRTE